MPQWPLPGDPPPGHSELVEDLPLPDHSETVTAVEEQITETFEPVDSAGSDPIETPSVATPAPVTHALPSSIIRQLLSTLAPPVSALGFTPSAPAPSVLYEVLTFVRQEIETEIQFIWDFIRNGLPRP